VTQGSVSSDQEEIRRELSVNPDRIREILDNHNRDRGGLIAILEEIQAEYCYLPEEALRMVSEGTGRSLVDIYGIATFYHAFSLKPRGKHLICACAGTACHILGAPRIVAELERQLGIKSGETTPDNAFTLETVNCLGACALGPVVVIDGRYFPKVRKSKIRQLLDQTVAGFDDIPSGEDGQVFPIEVSCPRCNHSLMDAAVVIDNLPSIRVSVSFDHNHSRLRLSCLYGSPSSSAEQDIPQNTVMTFYCPHCHRELADTSICPICEAPMASMMVSGGGAVRVCSRHGCKGRLLDLF